MYESLAEAARSASDAQTEQLALAIQAQERATAEKIWPHIGANARQAITRVRMQKAS
jgi:ferritin-like metal-binding protein YciE